MCNKTSMNLGSLSGMGFIVVFVWPCLADLLFSHWNRKEVLLLVPGSGTAWKNKCGSQRLLIAHQSLGASHHQLTSLTYPLINILANLVSILNECQGPELVPCAWQPCAPTALLWAALCGGSPAALRPRSRQQDAEAECGSQEERCWLAHSVFLPAKLLRCKMHSSTASATCRVVSSDD